MGPQGGAAGRGTRARPGRVRGSGPPGPFPAPRLPALPASPESRSCRISHPTPLVSPKVSRRPGIPWATPTPSGQWEHPRCQEVRSGNLPGPIKPLSGGWSGPAPHPTTCPIPPSEMLPPARFPRTPAFPLSLQNTHQGWRWQGELGQSPQSQWKGPAECQLGAWAAKARGSAQVPRPLHLGSPRSRHTAGWPPRTCRQCRTPPRECSSAALQPEKRGSWSRGPAP